MTETQPNQFSAFIYPCLVNCLKRTLFCPLDRCQIILQTQSSNIQVQNQKFSIYKSAFDFFKRMLRVESTIQMWRGNSIQIAQSFIPIIQQLPMLLFFDQIVSLMQSQEKLQFGQLDRMYLFLISGALYPVDLIRVRVMSDIGPQREFKGFFDCAKQIRSIDGFRGFYRGLVPHLVGLPLYRGSYFLAHRFAPRNRNESIIVKFIRSQMITLTSGFIAYPLLTVQRQMIMQSGRSDVLFKGFLGCVKQLYATGGVRQFYRGYLIGLLQIYLGTTVSVFLL